MSAWQSDEAVTGVSPASTPQQAAPERQPAEAAASGPSAIGDSAGMANAATSSRTRRSWGVAIVAVGVLVVGLGVLRLNHPWRKPLPVSPAETQPATGASGNGLFPAWWPGQPTEPPAAGPAVLPDASRLLQRAAAVPGTPEGRLLRVYALIASGDGERAFVEARQLAQDVPTFALAHLAYADLLQSRAAPLASFGAVPAGFSALVPAARLPTVGVAASASQQALHDLAGAGSASPSVAERLKDLSAEARARVGGIAVPPLAGFLPSQFVYVAPVVRHAIAVDASRSRLYVFDNTADGLVLRRDYYASVGKLGTAKRFEGDLRTPLGIYFVTGRLSKGRLADRYGASAMVLNYPNQYDLIRGRTGSGIWLHGVESTLFSRAPLATDGCVALSNIDLMALTRDVDRQATPVVIADRLDWVAAVQAAKLPDSFAQAWTAWRATRQQADPAAEFALYANAHADAYASLLRPTTTPLATAASTPSQTGAAFLPSPSGSSTGTTPANWIDVLRAERSRPGSAAAQLTQLSVLAWHDREDVMLVTYTETIARDRSPRLKRQYWLHRDGGWHIVFDGAVG